MIKNAFTLIEISIVLVAISIIMLITVFSKSLYDRLLFSKDLTKIYTLQNAILSYRQLNIHGLPDNVTNESIHTLVNVDNFKASSLNIFFSISQVNIKQTESSSTENTKNAVFFSKSTQGNNVAIMFLGPNDISNRDSFIFGCILKNYIDIDDSKKNKTVSTNGTTYELVSPISNKVAKFSPDSTIPYYQLPDKTSGCYNGPFELLGILAI